jgi:hypothetical protein
VRNTAYKSTEGLAKSERSEDLGADGRLFSDASHRERSELGEICTLATRRYKPETFEGD